NIPLSGPDLPAVLNTIDLEITVAGERFVRTFPRAPNQTYTFTWDGRDGYGRTVQGPQVIVVVIGYRYQALYAPVASTSGGSAGSFGRSPSLSVASVQGRAVFVFKKFWQGVIGAWDGRGEGLGGWSLNVHHNYDPVGRVLYRGDGGRITNSTTQVVTTV